MLINSIVQIEIFEYCDQDFKVIVTLRNAQKYPGLLSKTHQPTLRSVTVNQSLQAATLDANIIYYNSFDPPRMNTLVSKESTYQVEDVTSTTKLKDVEEDEVETDIETPFNSPERETNIGPSPSTSITELKKEKKSMYDDSDVEDKVAKALSTVVRVKLEGADEEDYSNWPMTNIKDPHENDVLYGRGGG